MLSFTYEKKRKWLLTLVFILILISFLRGIQLHLMDRVTNRISYHAIPVAMSVLYHHHPHDYTGLRAVELPFQSAIGIKESIRYSLNKPNFKDRTPYYWVADDKGFADYVIASFYLFGPHINSMYHMWFVILLASVSLFLISFGRQLWALGFLNLLLVGVHAALSALALVSLADTNAAGSIIFSPISLYETRFLDVLTLLSVFHMIFFATSLRPLNRTRDILALVGQLFIFIALYHARSSLGWQIVSLFVICGAAVVPHFYHVMKHHQITPAKTYQMQRSLGVIALLTVALVGLNAYKHIVYNPKYFSEMGTRTFWHNALMGFGYDAKLSTKYNLSIDDFLVAKSVIQYARDSHTCMPEIAQLEPQQLLNSLGNAGVADWQSYEQCAKQLYFSIVSQNKWETFVLYAKLKPLSAIQSIQVAMHDSSNPIINSFRATHYIGWFPLCLPHLLILCIVTILVGSSLFRLRKKLIPVVLGVVLFSFIPSTAFYAGILTQGGILTATPILLYLLLICAFIYTERFLINHPIRTVSTSVDVTKKIKCLSIVIPAFNEEKRIELTIQEVYEAATKTLDDFEIIVIDDGSRDATYQAAEEVAARDRAHIRVIRQPINKGVGAAFFLGLHEAKFPQLSLIPGDNAYNKQSIEGLFAEAGKSPLVITYRKNMEMRTPLRHLLSRIATLSLRLIAGFKIADAHSLYLFPVEETKQLNVRSMGYGYHIEILSRLLRNNPSFVEIPVLLNPKPDASSGVMKPKTLLILGGTIFKLFGLRLAGRL